LYYCNISFSPAFPESGMRDAIALPDTEELTVCRGDAKMRIGIARVLIAALLVATIGLGAGPVLFSTEARAEGGGGGGIPPSNGNDTPPQGQSVPLEPVDEPEAAKDTGDDYSVLVETVYTILLIV
jgi:hypothetical protein